MVVDPDLQVLCCLICQVALPPDHISGHIENAHPGLRLDDDRYSQAIFDAKIVVTLLTSITGGRYTKAYRGLKVHDGLACDSCSYVCGSKRTMGDHHRKEHAAINTPREWAPCKIQQLNKGANRGYWRVSGDDEIACDHQEVIDRMRKEMAEVITVEQVTRESRMVSPWLMATKWHEHVAGHDVSMLRKLVEIPKVDDAEMPHLQDAVEEYFRHAQTLFEVTDELILQRLNSPDPIKE
jgi:hypothetical protein